MAKTYDFAVIGGGIVGVATAMELLKRRPGASIVLIEKEPELGRHQTGHNSGVIHAGVYYKPGSLKAQLCRKGAAATKAFCAEQGIPFEERGKLIVATNSLELQRMAGVLANARGNGVEVEELDATALRSMEPNIAGLAGLFVRETGIVDYGMVCARLADQFRAAGGDVAADAPVDAIRESSGEVHIAAGARSWQAKSLVACAGLQSDRLARLSGLSIDYRIIPFRGEYFRVRPEKSKIVHRLIYPVPDPDLPFLGVHLTPMIDGSLTVGPNAVLSFAREKYEPFAADLADISDYLSFPGFWGVIAQHWKAGMAELRGSISKAAYLDECRKYCPSLEVDDLLPHRAGIRAQAVARDGTLIHDFVFVETEHMLHVCNAPSPAATSALPIAELIADRVFASRRS